MHQSVEESISKVSYHKKKVIIDECEEIFLPLKLENMGYYPHCFAL